MVDANDNFDHIFKILLVGDTGVGKSALLLRFTQDRFDDLSPTIGVDFRMKFIDMNSQRIKLTIWDTAGQERFRTLTSSYYRGAHVWPRLPAVIFAYDVTRRETFESIQDTWLQEVEEHSNVEGAIKMVVANKVDRDSEREVSRQEGSAFAKTNGCLFVETSAKANTAVNQAFEELVRKILESPELSQVAKASKGVDMDKQRLAGQSNACSC